MNIKANIATSAVEHADHLIHFIQVTPKVLLSGLFLMIIIGLIVGDKLSQFDKPENPKTSVAIREIAFWLNIFAKLMITTFLIYLFVIIVLVLFWISFSIEVYDPIAVFNLAINKIWWVAHTSLISIFSGSLLGLLISLYLSYYFIPQLEGSEGLDDVGQTVKRFKTLDVFSATKYFDYRKGCFVGKNLKGAPIYIPWAKLRETHAQILGTTGSGKGVIATSIASQCALHHEGVIFFDPKFCRYAPRILAQVAAVAKKRFHLINLNPEQPAQLNLIAGCSVGEIEELLVAGFDLRNKGSDADFYRGKDEDAAIFMANIAINESAKSIPELLLACAQFPEITEQENFWRLFKKLASLSVVNTATGLDLQNAILNGEVIYIIGSSDNERVKMLQKMLLVRVMQIIKKRDRTNSNIPVCVVLDEFKHLLSTTALNALGVVRDFDAHFILAHQSLGDLSECPGINPESAYGAVVDNTSIKILYRINDALHAEKMAKLSGNKRTFVKNISKNNKDKTSHSIGWKESTKYFISPDLITHLPVPSDRENQASVGVLFGLGNAKVLHIGRMKAKWEMPRPIAANTYNSIKNAEVSSKELI